MSELAAEATVSTPPPDAGLNGATPPAPTPGDWTDRLGDLKDWVVAKGLKSEADLAKSYRHLEVMYGADKAANTLIRPKPDAPPEERDAFLAKLGRPETPEKYDLGLAPDVDPEFVKATTSIFHKAGLPQDMAVSVAKQLEEYGKQLEADGAAERTRRHDAELTELRGMWGSQYDAQQEMCRRVARQFSIDDGKLESIVDAIGPKEAALLMARIGKGLGEASPPGAGAATFAPTPDEALAKISTLTKDAAFTKRLTSGDTAAKKEWNDLWEITRAG